MKVLYDWLKEFVALTAPPEELRTRLSLSGTAVDAIQDSPAGPVLDAEITINRPDCLGHLGVAREAAVIFRLPLKRVEPKLREAPDKAAGATRVEIECPELCARYTARVLRGVKVQPSPDWLRRRLEALGRASINNVVDATNYVLFELGQPLHAFDFDTLAEKRIVVRCARPGEKIRTLDGIERALRPEMCMIADATRAVAVGGVMGGAETEISFSSRNVLLESAWFDPISIRKTAKALGLRTEASLRFERGADPEMAELASRRCAELIQEVAGGEVLAGVVDAYPRPEPAQNLELTRKELLRIMGADIPDDEIEGVLRALGFAPARTDGTQGKAGSLVAAWRCRRPSWRRDVTRDVDLVEEVARHHGYDRFPSRLPAAKQAAARLPHAEADDRLRATLQALGYFEAVTIPLVDPARDSEFQPAGLSPARIANPLAQDHSVLRSSGGVTMLEALEWNVNRGQKNLRLYEIGKRYELREGKPVETPILSLGATGLAREKSVYESERAFAFADLKGDLDQLGALAGGLDWEQAAPEWLHPAQAATLTLRGRKVGVAGKISRRAADRYKLRQDVFYAELELQPLYDGYAAARAAIRSVSIPRFPAVERDFAFVLPDGTAFARVVEAIRSAGIAELVRIEAGDLFRGGQIPAGKHSLLVRVAFQSREATLTEGQLADASARIVRAVETRLGGTLRAT